MSTKTNQNQRACCDEKKKTNRSMYKKIDLPQYMNIVSQKRLYLE